MTKTRVLLLCLLLAGFAGCASSQKKLSQAREKDPRYQYSLGVFYLNGGQPAEAVKYLNRSLTLDPRYYLAHNALGLAASMQGRLEEAVKHYERCLEISPAFSEARNNLGSVYQELGLIDKAESEFLAVIGDRAYPTKELPNYNLARLYFTRGDFDQALTFVDAAIKLNSRFAMAHNLRGLVLEKQGKPAEAIDSYGRAVKIVPEDVTFNVNLGAAYFGNGDLEKAGTILQSILPRISDPATKDRVNGYLKEIRQKAGQRS